MILEKLKILFIAGLTILFMNSCATQSKSMALGGGIGASTGAALGGIADPGKNGEFRTRNVIIGGALGGLAGVLAGNALYNSQEQAKQEAYEKGEKNAKEATRKQGEMPALKNPQVEAKWIEGRVIGNRYVDGHFEYIIVEPARWDVQQ